MRAARRRRLERRERHRPEADEARGRVLLLLRRLRLLARLRLTLVRRRLPLGLLLRLRLLARLRLPLVRRRLPLGLLMPMLLLVRQRLPLIRLLLLLPLLMLGLLLLLPLRRVLVPLLRVLLLSLLLVVVLLLRVVLPLWVLLRVLSLICVLLLLLVVPLLLMLLLPLLWLLVVVLLPLLIRVLRMLQLVLRLLLLLLRWRRVVVRLLLLLGRRHGECGSALVASSLSFTRPAPPARRRGRRRASWAEAPSLVLAWQAFCRQVRTHRQGRGECREMRYVLRGLRSSCAARSSGGGAAHARSALRGADARTRLPLPLPQLRAQYRSGPGSYICTCTTTWHCAVTAGWPTHTAVEQGKINRIDQPSAKSLLLQRLPPHTQMLPLQVLTQIEIRLYPGAARASCVAKCSANAGQVSLHCAEAIR